MRVAAYFYRPDSSAFLHLKSLCRRSDRTDRVEFFHKLGEIFLASIYSKQKFIVLAAIKILLTMNKG